MTMAINQQNVMPVMFATIIGLLMTFSLVYLPYNNA